MMYGRPRPLPLTPSTQIPSSSPSSSTSTSTQTASATSTSAFLMRQALTHQTPLTRETLLDLLDSVQQKLFARRGGKQTTLVVHGGVVSVLGTLHRYVTTDVDYIERVLPEELEKEKEKRQMKGESLSLSLSLQGNSRSKSKSKSTSTSRSKSSTSLSSIAKRMTRALSTSKVDVRKLVKECVAEAAGEFNAKHVNVQLPHHHHHHSQLEDDWMNSAADVALPWRLDANNYMVDPLVTSAMRNAEEEGRVIYDKPGLRLIGITLSWTIALKLQRYTYKDQDDVVALLPFLLDNGGNNTNSNSNSDSDGNSNRANQRSRVIEMLEAEFADNVERHLIRHCPEMGIEMFPIRAREEWRARLRDCVRMAKYLMGSQRAGTGHD